MRIIRYNENLLDACAEFWWTIYEHMPYVHRPDGGQTLNTPPIGPEYFVKHLKAGFSSAWYFPKGNITDDSVILAEDEGKLAGMLVCSIEEENLTGNIMSCYVQRDLCGREIADSLLNEALKLFRKMGLCRAIAAPGKCRSMEVEGPIHLALLDAGFSWGIWENDWQQVSVGEQYGIFLGGWLEGFRLKPEIQEKREKLHKEGIEIKFVTREEFRKLRRYDTGGTEDKPTLKHCSHTFVALVDSFAVGWLSAWGADDDDPPGVMTGEAIPEVIPMYQRRGIGKVLYHLGIDELVRQGMKGGWTATGIYNPARLIYRSIGYRYWHTCFSRMTKQLR